MTAIIDGSIVKIAMIAQYIQYNVQCLLYTVYSVYSRQCTVFTVQCIMYTTNLR